MIKLLDFKTIASHKLELSFSDHTHGVLDGSNYLSSRQGPLLENLHEPAYFARCFVDAGAMCWLNGLVLSVARLHELVGSTATTTEV